MPAAPSRATPSWSRNLYASVLAYACNLGYAGMADASGISEDTLAWTSQWYLRQDTLRAANARLVNAHHQHPLTQQCCGACVRVACWPFPRMPGNGQLGVCGWCGMFGSAGWRSQPSQSARGR